MTGLQTFRHIVFPQVFRVIYAPLGNQFIQIVLGSSLASVVAARSKGWVVPTAAYTLASLVAFDRVNEHVHFSSDVFAGAVFGTVVGRYIVHKHEREAVGEPTKTSLDIVPIRNGLAARLTF